MLRRDGGGEAFHTWVHGDCDFLGNERAEGVERGRHGVLIDA